MRRTLATILVAGSIVSAGAACTDTLSIAGLRQFTLSFRSVRIDRWDSTEVSVSRLADARSLSKAPFLDTSELSFPVEFRSNCGTDSTDNVTFLRLRDYGVTERGDDVWKTTSDLVSSKLRVEGWGAVTLSGTSLKGFWEIDSRIQIGKLAGEAPKAFHVQYQVSRYLKDGRISRVGFRPYTTATRAFAFDGVAKELDALKPALDSVGGAMDSVRVSARITETSFSYLPTNYSLTELSAARRAFRPAAFTCHRTTHGLVFVLPQATALTVLSPEGRVVRTLAASSAPMWDGTDAAGHRVPRGVYLVRALGLGVIRIPAP